MVILRVLSLGSLFQILWFILDVIARTVVRDDIALAKTASG